MYIHVPSAWLAMMCCTIMTASAIGTLVWRHPSYAIYVYGSYGLAALVTIGITLWTWADGLARQKELAALEAAGLRRRSAGPKDGE